MPTTLFDVVLAGTIVLGQSPADKIVQNASIYQLNTTLTYTRTFQATPGTNLPLNVLMKATADPSGTTKLMMQRQIMDAEGVNNWADVRNRYAGVTSSGTGRIEHMYTDHLYTTVTGGATVGNARTVYAHMGVSNGRIEKAVVFEAGDLIIPESGTVQHSRGFQVDNIGHATNVQYATGIHVANFDATHAAIGIDVNTIGGPGKVALRTTGDAPILFRGMTRIGSNIAPRYPLDVTGDVQATGVYRFANGVILASGPGMPSYAAARGSVYLSTDFGLVINQDGAMGWARK
jgi:hypothetical protein